jgi:hypothetical protein
MDERLNKTPNHPDMINPDDRWAQEEWGSFELYERKRIRERRSRLLLIFSAMTVFLVLCSVPVIRERSVKWDTLRIARDLAVEVEKAKSLAIQRKLPVRMVFSNVNTLEVQILDRCPQASEPGKDLDVKVLEVVATKVWTEKDGIFKILTVDDAKEYSIDLVEPAVCFDPADGLINTYDQQVIAVVAVKDLSDKRLDRASYVVLAGQSARASIN